VALSLDGSAGCVAVLRVFMGCTLIIGRDEDLCCRLVREHLLSLGRQVVYLPEGQLFPGLHFTWELRDGDSNGTLELAEPSNYFITTEKDVQKLEPLSRILPLYLSEVVPGDPVHAYVVGKHVVFDGAFHLSAAAHCREVADSLGLTFCHLHIVRTVDDQWYCLGLDCMPYLFECAEQTRNIIVAHLVEHATR